MKRTKIQDKIKVTVTMPVYNAAICVEEAIQSVLSQKYDKFELLIVDDGSTDNSFEIIKKYKNHSKVRIYRNKNNLGVSKTRNKMIKLAQGKHICPCDADDIMLPDNIRILSQYLDKHSKVGVVYGDILVLDLDNKGKLKRPPFLISEDCAKKWDLLERFSIIPHPGSLIKRSMMLKVDGYDEDIYCVDDVSLWFKLVEITEFKHLKNEIGYIWRRYPESLTKKNSQEKLNAEKIKIKEKAIQRRYGLKFKI